ncbi:MAG: efflux RND transporter permease subunit [Armatimonadetes bacterium]|nr:efflux RND transporter permease subunit [Armatimonadota bacterium]
MNIARFAVSRPVAVSMLIAALVTLGAICLTRLPVDLLPSISFPTISVVTQWPNVAPQEIEAQVTRPVERAVASVNNVYEVSSSTWEGTSQVRVRFTWGTDIGQAAVDVLQQVERASRAFPTDPTLQNPTVFKFDPSQMPILTLGVSGEDDPVKLRTLMDNHVAPLLESADGVASVSVAGGLQRALMVEVDPERLRARSLALADVSRRLVQENLNLPAGIARESDTEYTVRSLGWFTSPEEVARIPVGAFGGRLVTLSEVATVRDAHAEQRIYSRLDGKPAVSITVTKQSGANTIDTARSVFEQVEQARRLYPHLQFGVVFDQAKFIEHSIRDVKKHAMIGGLLAILILLFFLRNVRSTLVVALSIPISLISTFALLYLGGFSLNVMSLGGMALATGLIVDDAVVVLENIFRHIERDRKDATEAAVSGTTEIMTAVVASTFTVMIVFLPLFLVRGQAGQMFSQFAVVVVFAMAVSLVAATTIVPMLASRLISGEAHHESMVNGNQRGPLDRLFALCGAWFDSLDASYRGTLQWALRHRFWVIAIALGITGSAFLLTPYIGTEMMPETDSGDLNVNVRMPVGTAATTTNAVVRQIEAILAANPSVETALATAGAGGMRGTSASARGNQGSVTVHLKPERKASTMQVIGELRREMARIPGARVMISSSDIVSRVITGGAQNLEVVIFGSELGTLASLARDAMDRLREIPGFENLDVNWQESTPEIQWKVDREKALSLGVTFADIANAINTATNGTVASYYQEEGFQYPIIVILPEAKRKAVRDLLNLPVSPASGGGRHVLLRQVARPEFAMGPSEITRVNRRRYISVRGTPQGRSPSEVMAEVEKVLSEMRFPENYYWEWGSAQKRQAQEFAGMGLAIILAILLIYMLLAAEFESFVHPFTVMLSVPLSTVGVALALFLSGRSFGLTAFIGLLMLVGIVVKNGILLVDYTNLLRARGLSRNEAVLRAGPTRLRPILMTSSASVLGMLPMAIAMGEGTEMQAPMATAVIGGLITSTFLTLLVVPTVYTLLDDVAGFLRRRRQKAGGSQPQVGGTPADGDGKDSLALPLDIETRTTTAGRDR